MRYRVTCLTPLLVGDGRKLSPIDYMVWKDHVNVLDQWRIFRLLAKGPRLDSYLNQLKTADKLDFASWGGFAQNFAGRRIPFENPASSIYWNRASGESLHIPTFACGASGPYLPAAAIKGALRTAMVFANWRDGMLQSRWSVSAANGLRAGQPSRGRAGAWRRRRRIACASQRGRFGPVATRSFKVYLLRTSTLQPRGGSFTLGWKQSPRGAVDGARPDDSTPAFAEMAVPGATFEGRVGREEFLPAARGAALHALAGGPQPRALLRRRNVYAAGVLAIQRQYASLGRHGPARSQPGRAGAAARRRAREGHLPAFARMGRRLARQERLARHHQPRVPPDPASSSRSTIARWPAICRSPRRAASSSWATARPRYRVGSNCR